MLAESVLCVRQKIDERIVRCRNDGLIPVELDGSRDRADCRLGLSRGIWRYDVEQSPLVSYYHQSILDSTTPCMVSFFLLRRLKFKPTYATNSIIMLALMFPHVQMAYQ
jgi:hypothetical protein